MKRILLLLLLATATNFSLADTTTINQKHKAFVVNGQPSNGGQITVNVGDTVRFVNDDEFFHNVFSLSDAKLFDLGSFPKGDHRDVEFDTAGSVEVECALHPEMFITIIVE